MELLALLQAIPSQRCCPVAHNATGQYGRRYRALLPQSTQVTGLVPCFGVNVARPLGTEGIVLTGDGTKVRDHARRAIHPRAAGAIAGHTLATTSGLAAQLTDTS